MVETAATIWADGPISMPSQPDKAKIRAWGTWLESFITGVGSNVGTVYQTRSSLYSDLAHPAGAMGWVLGDATVAYNGIYEKFGASGSGYWSRIGDLPYSFNRATNTGAGTPSAIQASSSIPVSSQQLIMFDVLVANDGSPVTISFNGASPLTIKTFTGNNLVQNELPAGAVVAGMISGSTFRLLYDQKYPYARATNAGSGTPDAIEATIPVGIDFSDLNHLIGVNLTAANTTTTPTISFNGGTPLAIKTNSGLDPVVGGLIGNLLGFVSGSTFRLISDQASAAIQTAAEAAAERASDYADFARNNWVANGPFLGTGAQADYPLTIDPGSANNMFVVVGGVSQILTDSAYALVYTGGSPFVRITVPAGIKFEVRISNAVSIGMPADGTVSTGKLAGKAVTYAKMQDVSAQYLLLGRKSAGAGAPEEVSATDLIAFLPSGSVIGSASATYVTNADIVGVIPGDDTIPQITEGTQILTVTITPKLANSKLRIRFSGFVYAASNVNVFWAVFNGTANAIQSGIVVANTSYGPLVGSIEYAPGGVTAQTISIRVGTSGGTTIRLNGSTAGRVFGGSASAYLTVEEVKA